MTLIIRSLAEEDNLLEISSIYEESWKYAYSDILPETFLQSISHGRWTDNLKRADLFSLVAVLDNRCIGTASICQSRFKECEGYGEIVSIYFLPNYMGKGYGKMLLSSAVVELQKMGYQDIFLWVLEENRRARVFYERNGFACNNVYREDTIGGKKVIEVQYCYIKKR